MLGIGWGDIEIEIEKMILFEYTQKTMRITFDPVLLTMFQVLLNIHRRHERIAAHHHQTHNQHISYVKYQFHMAAPTSEWHGS